ncbi:MAG: apolipoprotein N-acyltransferase [Candidatus Omnitrophica bacterium]|nr:apolipoprotein N-acyltransferase [Candidatus Omnitrophota bacterium]
MKRPLFLAVLSGILLALSFPKFSLAFLIWIALVPLLYGLSKASSPSQAVGLSLATGLVYFGVSVHWLNYVSTFGWVFVTFMEASALIVFGGSAFQFLKNKNYFFQALGIASAWMSIEILRTEIPIFGFGWNLLAYSQANYLWVIQSANTVGAYGLGFIIVFVNVCLMQIAQLSLRGIPKRDDKAVILPLVSIAFVFILLFSYGIYHLRRDNTSHGSIRISLIQGNIPQTVKWAAEAKQQILQIYSKLTELASFEEPDLVVWPEAAFPGYFNQDDAAEVISQLAQKTDAPFLIGALDLEDEGNAYNSAFFIDRKGLVVDRYDKLYLVPFGEYIPLKPIFGWLEPIAQTLGVSDFRAGKSPKIFKLQNGELPFSVLICFEDIFPNLARHLADEGAQFLTVITNDAWFGPTGAPYQHLQASILRAAEQGIPVVRAANTGISAFISSKGQVLDRVHSSSGEDSFVTGHKTLPLPITHQNTLYRRGGWLFPYAGIGCFVIMIFTQRKK